MSAFSEAELAYLRGERRLGRLATIDATGQPHVVPLAWRYNAELDAIDIGGHDFAATRKFHNVKANPKVAFLVDDLASVDPWRPRAVQVRGEAQALEAETSPGTGRSAPIIRITPVTVVSWGLER